MKRRKRRTMTAETRREILRLFRYALRRWFLKAAPKPLSFYMGRGMELMAREIEKRLRGAPEPSPKQLDELRAALQGEMPTDLQTQIRNLLQQGLKALPPAPRGARPKLAQKEKDEVCELIGKFTGEGNTLAEAIARIARKKGVSERTIKRVWMEKRSQRGGEQP